MWNIGDIKHGQPSPELLQKCNAGTGMVYKITPIYAGATSKGYVGITVRCLAYRVREHLRSGSGCINLHRALIKHGQHNFTLEVLQKDVPINCLFDAEKQWVKTFDTCKNGYNMTEGGDASAMLASAAVRKKHKLSRSSNASRMKSKVATEAIWKSRTKEEKDKIVKKGVESRKKLGLYQFHNTNAKEHAKRTKEGIAKQSPEKRKESKLQMVATRQANLAKMTEEQRDEIRVKKSMNAVRVNAISKQNGTDIASRWKKMSPEQRSAAARKREANKRLKRMAKAGSSA